MAELQIDPTKDISHFDTIKYGSGRMDFFKYLAKKVGLDIPKAYEASHHFWFLLTRKYFSERVQLPRDQMDLKKIDVVDKARLDEKSKGLDISNTTYRQSVRNVAIRQAIEFATKTVDLETQVGTDALTGALNRGAIDKILLQLFGNKKPGTIDAIAFIDIDYFKTFNDNYGHSVGDAALKELQKLVTKHISRSDYFARYGGEEFLVVLPEVNNEFGSDWHNKTLQKIDALRQAIAKELKENIRGVTHKDIHELVTASFGLFFADDSIRPTTNEELVRQVYEPADALLYAAKQSGRNRVVIQGSP